MSKKYVEVEYQLNATKRLVANVVQDLGHVPSNVCVLKAPTGSGKNVMIGLALQGITTTLAKHGKTAAFMVLSPRQLYKQTHKTLCNFFETNGLITSTLIDALTTPYIRTDQCLCINWESLNKGEKNTLNKQNETGFSLNEIVSNTKARVDYFIIVVDEQSIFLATKRSQSILKDLHPDTLLEFSATPNLHGNHIIEVIVQEVKESGMIKKNIIINPNFSNIASLDNRSLVGTVVKHRTWLEDKYVKEGSGVKPIYLMQIENKSHEGVDCLQAAISDFDSAGVTVANGKLAVCLSDQKENWDTTTNQPLPGVQFVVFKEALTYGWDCPQAQGIIATRGISNKDSAIQILGRINRMPERMHYADDDLNIGYIFTNRQDFAVQLDKTWAGYVKGGEKTARIRDKFADVDVKLPNAHRRRNRECTRLGGVFAKIFDVQVKGIQDRVKKPKQVSTSVIADAVISDIDNPEYDDKDRETHMLKSPLDIQFYYNRFLEDILVEGGVSGIEDSLNTLKSCLNRFFKAQGHADYDPEVQRIVLSNKPLFRESIGIAIGKYHKAVETKSYVINESGKPLKNYKNGQLVDGEMMPLFNFPLEIWYEQDQKLVSRPNSVMDLMKECQSDIECNFMTYLSEHPMVKCWYKNGENESKFLGIPYTRDKDGQLHIFYPDFIAVFLDGSIFIGDTKDGMICDMAGDKAKGLHQYLTHFAHLNVWGGIVAQRKGHFIFNDSEVFSSTDKKDDWKDLEKEFNAHGKDIL